MGLFFQYFFHGNYFFFCFSNRQSRSFKKLRAFQYHRFKASVLLPILTNKQHRFLSTREWFKWSQGINLESSIRALPRTNHINVMAASFHSLCDCVNGIIWKMWILQTIGHSPRCCRSLLIWRRSNCTACIIRSFTFEGRSIKSTSLHSSKPSGSFNLQSLQ